MPGGNWHYTDEVAEDAPVPNRDIATGDYFPSLPPKDAKFPYVEEYHDEDKNQLLKRDHRGPKPVWESLTSNAPAVRGSLPRRDEVSSSAAHSTNTRDSLACRHEVGCVKPCDFCFVSHGIL